MKFIVTTITQWATMPVSRFVLLVQFMQITQSCSSSLDVQNNSFIYENIIIAVSSSHYLQLRQSFL